MCILKVVWGERAELRLPQACWGRGKKVQAVVCLQRIVPQFSLGKALLSRPTWPACASMSKRRQYHSPANTQCILTNQPPHLFNTTQHVGSPF
jgi:hypothetical protein